MKTLNILLIEDNPGDARLIREMLTEAQTMPFQLVPVGNLAAGLGQLVHPGIDIVLLDLSLPDSQGLSTFAKIHQQAPDLPIVVLSGLSDEALALKAVHDGAQDYLVKGEVDSKWLVRSLTYALERKRVEQAEQELFHLKEEFLANASHQLRTPLTSLRGFLKFLASGKVKDQAVQQEFLSRAMQDTDRLMALVNDLLDQFRLENTQFQLEMNDEVDLGELIAETLHSLQGVAGQKGIRLLYDSSDSPLLVKANRYWLQQVLINLTGNAIKFSQVGSPVRVTTALVDNRIEVKVIDQGPGIPAEALPKLFSKFYQVPQQSKGNGSGHGTGLGLYIAKGVIEAHRGHIGVESQTGQGSTFFFTLPRLPGSRLKRLKREDLVLAL